MTLRHIKHAMSCLVQYSEPLEKSSHKGCSEQLYVNDLQFASRLGKWKSVSIKHTAMLWRQYLISDIGNTLVAAHNTVD